MTITPKYDKTKLVPCEKLSIEIFEEQWKNSTHPYTRTRGFMVRLQLGALCKTYHGPSARLEIWRHDKWRLLHDLGHFLLALTNDFHHPSEE